MECDGDMSVYAALFERIRRVERCVPFIYYSLFIHTLGPDSAHQETQPQYEEPVPQQHSVCKSNEVGKMDTV